MIVQPTAQDTFPQNTFEPPGDVLPGFRRSFGITALNMDREFEELFIEHYPRLVRTLMRLVGGQAQAEELASDAFCRLYQRGLWRSSDANAPGWLYRTAMNLGLDAIRANARRARREQLSSAEALRSSGPRGGPLDELLAEERRARVRNVIAQLKPVQGQALLMSTSGFTSKEMAAVLGVKPDSLYTLIARAKAQFEKRYLSLYGGRE